MARPYSFDPDTALDAAMHLFWRDGYDLATLSQLQTAMGIQRGSLYQEFGSKKELFLKALDRYVSLFVNPGIELLTGSTGHGRDRISKFFDMVPTKETRGCLLCNSAAGVAGNDETVRHAIATQLERLRKAFDGALSDEYPDQTVRRAEAERLTQTYIGKRVEARTQDAPDTL